MEIDVMGFQEMPIAKAIRDLMCCPLPVFMSVNAEIVRYVQGQVVNTTV